MTKKARKAAIEAAIPNAKWVDKARMKATKLNPAAIGFNTSASIRKKERKNDQDSRTKLRDLFEASSSEFFNLQVKPWTIEAPRRASPVNKLVNDGKSLINWSKGISFFSPFYRSW